MNSIEITTMIGCPLKCTLCPQDLLKKKYKERSNEKYLSLKNFEIILSKLPKSTEIIFSGFAEAWANPECNQMVELALKKEFKIGIYSTLTYFDIKKAIELIHILLTYKKQLVEFRVHLPDDNNMPGFKFKDEYNDILNLFNLTIKPNYMTMDIQAKPHQQIIPSLPISDWIFHTRSENLTSNSNIKPIRIKNEFYIECIRNSTYTSNVLLPNGDVVLCCMDYGLKHILGNLLSDSYEDIIYSKELEYVKDKNKDLEYNNKTLCRTCVDTYVRTPWNDTEIAKIYEKTL